VTGVTESTYETGGEHTEPETPDTDIPGTDVGVGIGVGEPNTFEPEEDPDAAPGGDQG
jgi:hypothetical protein